MKIAGGALLCALLACAPARAEPPAAPVAAGDDAALARYAGRYRWVGGAEEIARLDAAIELVVSRMNFLVRGIARRRVRQPNLPSAEIGIAVERGTITISRPGRPSVTAPSDGREISWKEAGGDTFDVSIGLQGGELRQRFHNAGSTSVNRFLLDASSGQLLVDTLVHAKRLPAPLHFRTTYQRVPPPAPPAR